MSLASVTLDTVPPIAMMSDLDADLPDDLQGCHALIDRLRTRQREELTLGAERETVIAKCQATIDEQRQTIELLAAENAGLKRALYGQRRERFVDDDPSQRLLFDSLPLPSGTPDAEQPAGPEPPARPRRTSKGRRPRIFPELLPREELRIPLDPAQIPEELRDNPDARRFFKRVGAGVEIIPMQMKWVEQYQEVIVLDRPDATTTMFAPPRPRRLVNCFAGPSLLAYLTVSRFADHLPYYRLEDIFGRSGFRIDRSTLWRWIRELSRGVTPLTDLMWDRALLSSVMRMDETHVAELGGVGRANKGYLWAGVGDAAHPYDCFFYTSDRRAIGPETWLADFRGYLVADSYIAYERIGRLREDVTKCGCWSHARRKFEAIHKLGATPATRTAMRLFNQVFLLEQLLSAVDDATRLATRLERSAPIVEELYAWLRAERLRQLPKSAMAGAINYMLNHWESYTRFLESGAVPLDNNAAERAVKFPVLGRKAWLFVGNHAAGEVAARMFTLTKTCNRHWIDPMAYLQDVYARLPTTAADELPSLLPDRWIEEHPQHRIPERIREAIERAQRARERRAERLRAA